MVNDELLRTALIASFEERMALCRMEIKEDPHRFSLAYKIRKRSVIRFAEHCKKAKEPPSERTFMPLRRLALIMAIIAAAVVLSVGAYAAYLIINGFVFDMHEEYSDVTLDISEYELKDTITEFYWIPPESGWESTSEIHGDTLAISKYYQGENIITLGQYTKLAAEQFLKFNTEDANVYGLIINGNDGFISIRHVDGIINDKEVVWVMNGYVFYLSCRTISDEELVKLAESVKIKETLE